MQRPEKLTMISCQQFVTSMCCFRFMANHFAAIRKPYSRRIAYKFCIFINNNLLHHKNWKYNWIIFNTALILLLWKQILLLAKKRLTSGKLRRYWYYNVCFLKLNMCVYLRIKFQVSSIILTNFRQWAI